MKSAPKVVGTGEEGKHRILKFIGSAVLLVSFVTQNFLYDRWNSKVALLEQGAVDRALIDKSVLLNEVLYFTAQPTSETTANDLKEAYIREAARKLAISSIIPITSSQAFQTQQKVNLSNALLSEARGVKDFPSFLALVKKVNDSYGRYSTEMTEEALRMNSRRALARYIYLALYVIGTLLLLAAVKKE